MKNSKHVKFNDNRKFLSKVADFTEMLSNLIYKFWPIILIILALGIVGHFEMEDEICKNPNSKQCIEYKLEQQK